MYIFRKSFHFIRSFVEVYCPDGTSLNGGQQMPYTEDVPRTTTADNILIRSIEKIISCKKTDWVIIFVSRNTHMYVHKTS